MPPHVRVEHPATAVPQVPKAKKLGCLQCTRKFQGAQALARHVRDKHPAMVGPEPKTPLAAVRVKHMPLPADNSFQQACPCCEHTFATDAELVKHMHKEHPALQCPACGSSFKHARDLLRHHRYVHEPVPCQHCLHLMHTLAQLQSVHGC
jgi:uncharacterized C2H2 Zn-finger protein